MAQRQYGMLQRLHQEVRSKGYGRCFSFNDKRMIYVHGHEQDFGHIEIRWRRKLWSDEKENKQMFSSGLFPLHRAIGSLDSNLETGVDLSKTIRRELKLSERDAAATRDKLFEEIDQMTKTRNVEPLSATEKDQLILAIIKTAQSLSKKTLETK